MEQLIARISELEAERRALLTAADKAIVIMKQDRARREKAGHDDTIGISVMALLQKLTAEAAVKDRKGLKP